jgi:hypothetical protein
MAGGILAQTAFAWPLHKKTNVENEPFIVKSEDLNFVRSDRESLQKFTVHYS